MKRLAEIPPASVECNEYPEEEGSRKIALARRLEAAGHQTVAIGRAIVTIERCDSTDEAPPEAGGNWGTLKISIYSDPDVSGNETPVCLFVDGGRHGFNQAVLQMTNEVGLQRIFNLKPHQVRSEF